MSAVTCTDRGITIDSNGNKVERFFDSSPDRCRYEWDGDPGWEQFDTDQDAWYFGVWVNKQTRQIRVYAEGDLTVTTCPTVAHFNAEIRRMCEPVWPEGNGYGEGFIAKAIGPEGTTVLRQDRTMFLIEEEES